MHSDSADLTGSSGTVDALTFQVANAAAGEPIDLTVGATIIKYSDSSQTRNLDQVGEFTINGSLGTSDGDDFLERGEVFEVGIPAAIMTAMSPRLFAEHNLSRVKGHFAAGATDGAAALKGRSANEVRL